jgi:MoxR-like ATPase
MSNEAASYSEQGLERFQTDFQRLQSALERVLVGQSTLIRDLLVALLARGHVLLEGLPGLGKTHLAKGLANALGIPLARVQCTPDLMPADITGSEIMVEDETGHNRYLEFRQGPIFAPMVLVDEINRATPKTQAALLEAMQEGQVTYAGKHHELPHPFWVIATQNPIELEGTYPLPEAQLDRFLFKLRVTYPKREALLLLLDRSLDREPSDEVSMVISAERVLEMIKQAQASAVAPPIKEAAVGLILATHPEHAHGSPLAKKHFAYGASPRALQAILRAARVWALAQGRAHVAHEDLQACVLPVLRHRIILRIESELENISVDETLEQITKEWTRR